MVLGRLAMRCISVVSTLLLVRLLQPADFGLVALAAATFVIADVLTSTNFGLVLIRRANVDRDLYDTAWTMNIIRCLLLGGLVAATAHAQALMLGDERIAPLLMVVALTVLLDGLVSIGMVRLQRQFQFGQIFRYQVTGKVLSFLITVVLAWATHSYWCLVLGNLATKLLLIPYSYLLAPHRPRLSLQHWRELINFSKWMAAINLCMAADGQGPNLVLGRVIGVEAVGLYNVSYQIAATPVTELAAPIRSPIYSGYARVLHDPPALGRQFLDGFGLLCALIVPLSVGIALTAPEVQRLALGATWADAAPMIVLCALYALADSMAHFTFNVFTVLDRQKQFVMVYAVLVLLRVPAIIAAALLAGPLGVLATMLVTAVINAVAWHRQAGLLLGHGLGTVAAHLWRSFAAAAVMSGAVLFCRAAWPMPNGTPMEAFLSLTVLATVGGCVHLCMQFGLWRLSGAPDGPERTAARFLATAFERARRRWPGLAGHGAVAAGLYARTRPGKQMPTR